MADFLCIKHQTYSAYERQISLPDINIIYKLSDYFGVSVDYLLGKSDNKKTNNEENSDNKVNELLPDIDDLTPENKEDLKKYYELLKIKQKVDENNNAKTSSSLKENA
jgi:transcriptional regulator with XRE-family HTH domain